MHCHSIVVLTLCHCILSFLLEFLFFVLIFAAFQPASISEGFYLFTFLLFDILSCALCVGQGQCGCVSHSSIVCVGV